MSQQPSVNILSTRVRELIADYEALRKRNSALTADVTRLTNEIQSLKSQLENEEKRYNALMTAKMLSVADRDLDAAKQRITNLQRSVSHCITLLTEKESSNDGLSTEQ